MKQSAAWIVQVESDFAVAEMLFRRNDATTYCQAIAKYQQTVEKSVKAMVAVVNDLGSDLTITASHLPTNEIDGLLRLRRVIDNVSVDRLTRIFKMHRGPIENLCKFAPRWPEDGETFARNTEYPFLITGTWTAPAADGSFTLQEATEAQSTAKAFHKAAIDFVSSVKFGRL
ncbi:MAG: hypothetical protein ACRYFS_26000 [Janthinobacterium lividum]